MAYSTYLDLTNALRDRFNEIHLTQINFGSVVGFDQFTKDAINYAYHDILNAEMEWPFLHQSGTFKTVPGTQFYDLETSNDFLIKTIDWGSFYINSNPVTTTIASESATIPASNTLSVAPAQIASWFSDLGVKFSPSGVALTPVTRDPENTGEYTIQNGYYYFATADAGKAITLSYTTAAASTINVVNAIPLSYMDYDMWRQSRLQIDLSAINMTSFGQPQFVIKTQQQGQIALSPIPDKIYYVNFEFWYDTSDMAAYNDVSILPTRFNQIILDGATKYCYEFREDPQQAQLADARFKAGIARMRIELINRDSTMQTGIYWYPKGYSYTMNRI